MTQDRFPQAWPARLIEAAKIVGALSMLITTTVGAWAWIYGPVGDFFARIDTLIEDVAALKADVARATGDNRVIRQTPGLSYVAEPVYVGENVVMIMVAERTTLGRGCRLTDWSPLFSDDTGIQVPGVRAIPGPVRRQIGAAATRLRIEMVPPDTLRPGRIELYLALTYDCAGSAVYDRSDPVIFRLLEGPRPEPAQ